MEKMNWKIPTGRIEKFFDKGSREDVLIALMAVFAWLLVYAGMAAAAPLSALAVCGISAIIFCASLVVQKLMMRYPRLLAVIVFGIFVAFTLIHLGLSRIV